ncbi:MAG: hypothetical protein JW797_04550 [Bradymonadales bacterium]|nr:hypothetical protein [Bradymonadales bacterium]
MIDRKAVVWRAAALFFLLFLAWGCSDDQERPATDVSQDDLVDDLEPDIADQDLTEEQDLLPEFDSEQSDPIDDLGTDAPDALEDLVEEIPVPPDFPLDPILEPVAFRVGVAFGPLPAPLGIGTSGYGPSPGPISPFADRFPATNRIVMHPEAKVLALEGGMNRLLLFNVDLVGISAEARHSLIQRLEERTGLNLADSIFIGATHTHGGPGRLTTHPAYALAQDRFWPQYYDRFIEFLADLAITALSNLEAGRFGYTFLESNALGNDRRCQTPQMMTGTLALLRFDDADGVPIAAALSYPVHSTVVDMTDFTLTADVAGAIKHKIQERFDHLVPVLFFDSWGGDVSPAGIGEVEPTEGTTRKQVRYETLGNLAADLVMPAFELIETSNEIEVSSLTADIELSMEAIGYTYEEWPHIYGAVYCGMNLDAACWGEGDPPSPSDLIYTCFPLFEEWTVNLTSIGVGRIGDLALAAFPGEPCTQIGLQIVEEIRQISELEDVMFIGYAQDYCGYSETYDYWWLGGYEASGAIWGPRQGEYISAELLALAEHFFHPTTPLSLHQAEFTRPILPSDSRLDYQPEPSLSLETVVQEVEQTLQWGQAVTFTFLGGDPWLGVPRVELETYSSEEWLPVLRHNGTILASDAYEIEMRLDTANPSYNQSLDHTAREFRWTAILPTSRNVPSTTPPLVGLFRLKVTGQAVVGDEVTDYEVYSDEFEVTSEE